MRTKTKAAIALMAVTNLCRVLLAGLAVIALASCGGGGSEEASPNQSGPRTSASVFIEVPNSQRPHYTTEERSVELRGFALIFPPFTSCTASRAGVRIDWSNAAGGGGAAVQHVTCFSSGSSQYIDDHTWTAQIPLVVGANVITVTAADSSGNMGRDTITITRLSLPETETTHLPTVSSTVPTDGATNVSVNSAITAHFSWEMASWSITEATFLLVDYRGAPVSGTVSYFGNTATFDPAAPLWRDWTYTATITTGARDLSGNAMASAHVWTFTTGR